MNPTSPKTSAPLVVAFQGSDGAYSQLAAEQHFYDRPIECRGYVSFRAALQAVERGEVACAMQPIENTTAGSINEAYDLLVQLPLFVIGEEVLRIEHRLIGLPGATLSQIRRILSHPQALAQCSHFLDTLTDCTVQAFTNTATSVERVRAEGDATQAAIAGDRAARINNLSIIERDIANVANNFTRFVVVARAVESFPEDVICKTSLVFTTRHEQGALVRCLSILAEHGLNLTKLESRPRPDTPFEYHFYVDFEGNVASDDCKRALEAMQRHTTFFKVLGTYPSRTSRQSSPSFRAVWIPE